MRLRASFLWLLLATVPVVACSDVHSAENGDQARSVELFNQLFIESDTLDAELLNEAKSLWHKLVDEGDPDAQFFLSLIYFEGLGGVEQDSARAMQLISLSAEGGNKGAQYRLARSVESGEFHKQNLETALCWYQLSASQGGYLARERLKRAHASGDLGLEPGSDFVDPPPVDGGCPSAEAIVESEIN